MNNGLLREPLLHFVALGALIFVAFSVLDDTPPPVADNVLSVTDRNVESLVAQFEATWRHPPTASEQAALIDRFVEEEILVREARALGLDRGDAIVRQRLAQKMVFLLESASGPIEVSDEALAAHLAQYPDRFRNSALVAFEQVAVPDGSAKAMLAQLADGARPDAIGGLSLLPASLDLSPRSVVDATFGPGFFDAVSNLSVGAWAGPVQSAYGPHLVRLKEHRPERLPAVHEIRQALERDWRARLREDMRKARISDLLSRYRITRPDSGDDP